MSARHQRKPAQWALAAIVLALAPAQSASGAGEFSYDAENVGTASHWAARSTLANAVMFSGIGEPLNLSMSQMDEILRHAGYTTRPPMPDMAVIGAAYRSASPKFVDPPDFSKPQTLRWDPESFDRTLDPAAQAWSLIKITNPEFHLLFHDDKADKRVALMMLPQAEAQAEALERQLLTDEGLFAARMPEGAFEEPRPIDQAAVLWGVSNLILAATSDRDDYWHGAYRDLIDPDDYRGVADQALAAVEALPPETPAGRAVTIEALGRYALAAEDEAARGKVVDLARLHAEALLAAEPQGLADLGLAIYGLVEAGRLFGDAMFGEAAASLFQEQLLPRWDEELGIFSNAEGDSSVSYTPFTVGALVAGLNAMRWHGPEDLAGEAEHLYPRFFEAVLVEGGLLLSSPLPLVPEDYREQEPDGHFAHPALPDPAEAMLAPVFAAEVVQEAGGWKAAEPTFRTADAMFLASMLAKQHEGRADPFLPEERLAGRNR
jgi:hypothetical protein